MRYEIFNPIDGKPICTVRYLWLAKLFIRLAGITAAYAMLDYAQEGQGWPL